MLPVLMRWTKINHQAPKKHSVSSTLLSSFTSFVFLSTSWLKQKLHTCQHLKYMHNFFAQKWLVHRPFALNKPWKHDSVCGKCKTCEFKWVERLKNCIHYMILVFSDCVSAHDNYNRLVLKISCLFFRLNWKRLTLS